MKAAKNIFSLAICLVTFSLGAQSESSYGKMQNRFEKKSLEPADSAAFIEAGMQKAQTLFEYNTVYLQNSTNVSNQKYVEKKVPELFFVAEGDSVDIDLVMQKAQAIVRKQTGKPVELKFEPKEGVLGQVSTINTSPTFKADLIIVKVNKAFGKMSKQVWQVFLANPTFEE
ncbi:hypothetical protein [Owenweeksia hongkongensis]|uniref:hypothetical protein n=1 Tax=Owenweeksia hongkongensis TaxID=253245 RepID=UPI003A8D8E7A